MSSKHASTASQVPEAHPTAKLNGGSPNRERAWDRLSKPDPVSKRLGWLLVIASTTAVVVLGLFIFILDSVSVQVDNGPVALGQAYLNNDVNFRISPPINWTVDDHFGDASVAIKGPQERGMSPLILVAMEIAPGRLQSYLEEHKRRLSRQDPTLQWLSDEDTWIDGCHVERLEYECDVEVQEGKPKVRVHALQYIFDNKPRFYRVTCFVSATLYERYRAKFQACAESFARTPLVTPFPSQLK
ncbi:MAG: hypothetical protein KIS92_05300 [Planctomycetota bacterium]|nr:hypothetical protein [Planctomycetota bacterium]